MSDNKSKNKPNSEDKSIKKKNWFKDFLIKNRVLLKFISLGFFLTILVFVFAGFMSGVTQYRSYLDDQNFRSTSEIYGTEVQQNAPSLNKIQIDEDNLGVFEEYFDKEQDLEKFAQNADIVSSNGKVVIEADFVKKGLVYQPSFKSSFDFKYVIKNNLEEKSLINFTFPFPGNIERAELNNVSLIVREKVIENAKVDLSESQYSRQSGLEWEGELKPNEEVEVNVKYDTKGLGSFNYIGFENQQGTQDFNLDLEIRGTRSYNVISGLSVDSREFTEDSVKLNWDKQDLFSVPQVGVEIGSKLNPSQQMGRIYIAMPFIFIAFFFIMSWASLKNKKELLTKDIFILTFLFVLSFPLLHYLTSFRIDPTLDLPFYIASDFSLPLGLAFVITLCIIVGLISFLTLGVYGKGYTFKTAIPTSLIMLGFFPFVITIPEYSILLVLLGIALLVFGFIYSRRGEVSK
jgi:hypothetical protein